MFVMNKYNNSEDKTIETYSTLTAFPTVLSFGLILQIDNIIPQNTDCYFYFYFHNILHRLM